LDFLGPSSHSEEGSFANSDEDERIRLIEEKEAVKLSRDNIETRNGTSSSFGYLSARKVQAR